VFTIFISAEPGIFRLVQMFFFIVIMDCRNLFAIMKQLNKEMFFIVISRYIFITFAKKIN